MPSPPRPAGTGGRWGVHHDLAVTESPERTDPGDHGLLGHALAALLREVSGEHERRAIAEQPYEDDPDLAWRAPPGPDLPYDGDVPEEVRHLAAERRGQYRQDRG